MAFVAKFADELRQYNKYAQAKMLPSTCIPNLNLAIVAYGILNSKVAHIKADEFCCHVNKTPKSKFITLFKSVWAPAIQPDSAKMLARGTAVKTQGAKHNVYCTNWVEYEASTIIQSLVQDYWATAKIQAIARMYSCWSDYVEYWAATAIQSVARMYLCRMDYVNCLTATTIQSVAIIYLSQLDYIDYYQAATAIQKCSRLYLTIQFRMHIVWSLITMVR